MHDRIEILVAPGFGDRILTDLEDVSLSEMLGRYKGDVLLQLMVYSWDDTLSYHTLSPVYAKRDALKATNRGLGAAREFYREYHSAELRPSAKRAIKKRGLFAALRWLVRRGSA